MIQQFEEYILFGGAQGALKNKLSVYQHKCDGKYRYILQRIFLSYDEIKSYYPVLQKFRVLTPIFHCVRWLNLLFKGDGKRLLFALRLTAAMSDEAKNETQTMLQYLGLE